MIRFAIAAALAATVATPASAQLAQCPQMSSMDGIERYLGERFGEVPDALYKIDDTQFVVMFRAPDGSTWTAVLGTVEGEGCALGAGDAWVEVPQKPQGDPASVPPLPRPNPLRSGGRA